MVWKINLIGSQFAWIVGVNICEFNIEQKSIGGYLIHYCATINKMAVQFQIKYQMIKISLPVIFLLYVVIA